MYFTNIDTNINDTGAVVNEFIRLFVSLGPVGLWFVGWLQRVGGVAGSGGGWLAQLAVII